MMGEAVLRRRLIGTRPARWWPLLFAPMYLTYAFTLSPPYALVAAPGDQPWHMWVAVAGCVLLFVFPDPLWARLAHMGAVTGAAVSRSIALWHDDNWGGVAAWATLVVAQVAMGVLVARLEHRERPLG